MSPAIALFMLVTSAVVPIAQGITSPEHKSQKRTKDMEAETDANSLGLDVKAGGHIVSHLQNGNEDFDEAVDMPKDCQKFAEKCGQSPGTPLNINSWSDTAAAFEVCCLAGNHLNSTCSSIAKETFDDRKGPFALDTSVCSEMMDLHDAHVKLKISQKASTDNAVSLKATLIANRMVELQKKAPKFVGALLAGLAGAAAVTTGGATLAQVSIASVAVALASTMQTCGRRAPAPAPPPPVVTAPTTPAPSPTSNEEKGNIWFNKGGNSNGITGEPLSAEWNKFWTKDEGSDMYRPEYVKFKSCMGNVCEDCQSEAACGWKRYDFGEFTHLDTDDNKVHVAEYWSDCTSTGALWWVKVLDDRAPGGSCATHGEFRHFGYSACEAGAFQNADIKVYFAEEGGHMKGELQGPPLVKDGWKNGNGEAERMEWSMPQPVMGSSRLYIVIEAKDKSKKVQLGIEVKVTGVPNLVDDCMAHKMCVNNISDAGSGLRNNNTLQLQCLKNEVSGDAALVADCQRWTSCLDANPAHKDILQAILEAGLPQTSGTLLAEREKTPNGEVTGECAHPAHDDPESWECECSAALYEACADRWADLAACIEEKMCASDKVCATWKQDKGCPGFLLSEANLSVQESQPVMRSFPDGTSLQGQGEDQQAASMEESLAGKRSC